MAPSPAKPAASRPSAQPQTASTASIPAASTSTGTARPGRRRVEKPQSRTHSQASSATAAAISAAQASAPSQMQRTAAGISSAADNTRLRRSGQREGRGAAAGSACAGTVTPLPPAEFADGLGQGFGVVIGPEHVLEDELGIGRLPEQEVGQALLARGADDEVGIGHVRGEEPAAEARLVQGGGVEPALARCL